MFLEMKQYDSIVSELKRQDITFQDASLPLPDDELALSLLFNGFSSSADYLHHLEKGYNRVKQELEQTLNLFSKPLQKIKLLNHCCCSTNNLKNKFNEETINGEKILSHFALPDFKLPDPIKRRVSGFLAIQLAIIQDIESFVSHQIEFCKLTLQYDILDVGGSVNAVSELIWNKSQSDLVELIIALYESNAITTPRGKLTKKDLLTVIGNFLNMPINNPYVRISQLISRKKENTPFLTALQKNFSNFAEDKFK